MAKKLWSQLAASTQKRYKRAGISPQQYNSGRITPERKQEIYGKRHTSWEIEIAKQKGLASGMRVFDTLSFKQKQALANAYLGKIDRRRPLIPGENGAFEITPVDTRQMVYSNKTRKMVPNPNYGKALKTVAQMESEMDFEDLLFDMGWEDFEWTDDVREQLEASSSQMQSAGQ